ncbi:MAG: RNA methyltransferase [Candidatus Kapabacteria bacterium]|nr:RNA methyltransferase [Candidatus Kapabacteria bacterium]MDW8011797.1 TrmH family RNA methyltransferase [Bacteroidota bacterium]
MIPLRERTAQRRDRIAEVLHRRQPDLTVVLENVHDTHNVSAVLRTCDAVGVLEVYLVYTVDPFPEISHRTSASAYKWLILRRHRDIATCYAALRSQGYRIWATAVRSEVPSLYSLNLTLPTALVFGNEHRGVSEEALEAADGVFWIPQVGMVQSLNISVACAVALYEAFRQRWLAGMYEQPRLPQELWEMLLQEFLQR